MIGEVERPNKNIRYKLVNVEGEYYILDQDRPIWLILFPFIYWFKSHIVYQINQATYEKLKQPDEKKRGKWEMILPVAFISPFLGRVLASKAERYNHLSSSMVSVVLIIVFIMIMISVRIYVHQTCFKKTDKITDGLEMLSKRKIKIRPKKVSIYLGAVFTYFLFLSIAIMGGFLVITLNNPTPIVVLVATGMVFLLSNTVFINIGDAKVKYLENKYDEERSTHESN